MSKNVKCIILSVILVLCLGGIILEIYPKYMKLKSISDNATNSNKIDNINKPTDDNTNNDNSDINNDNIYKNIYDKYSDIKWARTEALNGLAFDVKIENGSLIFTNNSINTSVLEGKPIKVVKGTYCFDSVYVLTDKGNVYFIGDGKGQIEVKRVASNYNIIDMTMPIYDRAKEYVHCGTNESIYFLTSDGELLDEKGVSYEENNSSYYAMYYEIEWSGTEALNGLAFDAKIEDESLIFLNNNIDTSTIEGKPIKVVKGTFCFDSIYVLTDERNAYFITDGKGRLDIIKISFDHKIIDMTMPLHDRNKTGIKCGTEDSIYFLTDDGRLINSNGVSYYEKEPSFLTENN